MPHAGTNRDGNRSWALVTQKRTERGLMWKIISRLQKRTNERICSSSRKPMMMLARRCYSNDFVCVWSWKCTKVLRLGVSDGLMICTSEEASQHETIRQFFWQSVADFNNQTVFLTISDAFLTFRWQAAARNCCSLINDDADFALTNWDLVPGQVRQAGNNHIIA